MSPNFDVALQEKEFPAPRNVAGDDGAETLIGIGPTELPSRGQRAADLREGVFSDTCWISPKRSPPDVSPEARLGKIRREVAEAPKR